MTILKLNSNNPNGIKLITRLKLVFSCFRAHKFRYNFLDILNPIYSWGDNIKISIHYLLHCSNSLDERRRLLDNFQNIGQKIHHENNFQISEKLLFRIFSNNGASYLSILNATIQYILVLKDLTFLLLTHIHIHIHSHSRFTFLNTYDRTSVSNHGSHKI